MRQKSDFHSWYARESFPRHPPGDAEVAFGRREDPHPFSTAYAAKARSPSSVGAKALPREYVSLLIEGVP
jgi:hypothetical protein